MAAIMRQWGGWGAGGECANALHIFLDPGSFAASAPDFKRAPAPPLPEADIPRAKGELETSRRTE